MSWLLDTSAAVAILRGRPLAVRDRLRAAQSAGETVAVSSVVLYELWYGVARSDRREENTERIQVFLSGDIIVLPFEAEDSTVAGELRASLDATGTPIGPYDLLIAAQALRSGMTLVSSNTSEFARVPGLPLKDWTRPI